MSQSGRPKASESRVDDQNMKQTHYKFQPIDGMTNHFEHPRGRSTKVLHFTLILLALTTAILLVFLVILTVRLNELRQSTSDAVKTCPRRPQNIYLAPPRSPPPFHDLTKTEIGKLTQFLYAQSDLNLVPANSIAINTSYIFTMELKVPPKDETIEFLDNGKTAPAREANVVIFRGDLDEPMVEEYVVGPLPVPSYFTNKRTRPFIYRPFTAAEYASILGRLTERTHQTVGHILQESYGGRLVGCSDDCLVFQIGTPMSAASTGMSGTRKMWFWLVPLSEYKTVLPLDFLILVDSSTNDAEKHTIDKVYYAGRLFDSLELLRDMYDTVNQTRVKYPYLKSDLFSSPQRRGTLFPTEPLLPPEEIEADGHRFSIRERQISYMGWQFNVRMSTISGPQLFNIRYRSKRIVYELSLQEIVVLYSGHFPAVRYADFADSVSLIGKNARALVPGYDCPKHAVYIPIMHKTEGLDDAVKMSTSFCVFEHNTGLPLRRHLSPNDFERQFYEGLVDNVLTLRTIVTIANYDYIFDFIFHQNGALETKVSTTGYIFGSFRYPKEDMYGFRLKEHLTGNIHQHLFHFKVDMDINGRENRFETLSVLPEDVENSEWFKGSNSIYSQTKLVRQEIKTEKEAVMDLKFEEPQYLIFHNNNFTTEYGVPRAYRLLVSGASKQLSRPDRGQAASYSWAGHQLAVTHFRQEESRSSSLYASWDGERPVVDFRSFVDDDEIISDQDQVTWVTMGVHHIPHTEDLPLTTTVGLSRQFFLLPYNYFPEDPALGSGDAVRIVPKTPGQVEKGVRVNAYGKKSSVDCVPEYNFGLRVLENNPSYLFD